MVTKKIRSQMLTALIHIIESLVLMIICAYCSVGVYRDSAGTRGKNYGLKKVFANWIYQMEDQGNDTLVKLILWAMFGAAAIAALFALIYFLLHLTPGRTKLGRSIRQQAASYEKLSDLAEMINTDMERESHTFGTELHIGPQWMPGEEAMRLNRIRRIALKEGFETRELVVTDLNQNQISVLFSSKEDLVQAACYLKKKLPEVPVEGLPEGIAAQAWDFPADHQVMEESTPSSDSQQTFALAIAAPLRMVNFEYEKELGSVTTSEKKQAKMQKELAKNHKIKNREQLIAAIHQLYLGEKTAAYDALMPFLSLSTTDERQEFLKQQDMDDDWQTVFFQMIEKAQKLFDKYNVRFPKSHDTLYALELAKAATLAVHGAAAGYLTPEEELTSLLETGSLAELYYHSWDEYAGAFLLGYFFDTFFQQSSASHAEIYMAGKSEVKEVHRFLKDKTFFTCPFGTQVRGTGTTLPEHYHPKLHI